jgi:hypothetical protein
MWGGCCVAWARRAKDFITPSIALKTRKQLIVRYSRALVWVMMGMEPKFSMNCRP